MVVGGGRRRPLAAERGSLERSLRGVGGWIVAENN